jgi:hypothetical protein
MPCFFLAKQQLPSLQGFSAPTTALRGALKGCHTLIHFETSDRGMAAGAVVRAAYTAPGAGVGKAFAFRGWHPPRGVIGVARVGHWKSDVIGRE